MKINLKNVISEDILNFLKTIELNLHKNKFELRIVGGFVRKIIQNGNFQDSDIDLSTTATPNEVRKCLQNMTNLHIINSGGEIFGTLILHNPELKINFEITSTRLDIRTFGRFADVKFIPDFFEDSKRRDFTVNALYLNFDGEIFDFHKGISDLKNSTIKFIGSCEKRIQEDFLRIIRYFRFAGEFGNFSDEIIDKCTQFKENLKIISPQRIRSELLKFCNKNNLIGLEKMNKYEILSEILPNKFNLIHFSNIKDENLKLISLFYDKNFEIHPQISGILSSKEKKILNTLNNIKKFDIINIYIQCGFIDGSKILEILNKKSEFQEWLEKFDENKFKPTEYELKKLTKDEFYRLKYIHYEKFQ